MVETVRERMIQLVQIRPGVTAEEPPATWTEPAPIAPTGHHPFTVLDMLAADADTVVVRAQATADAAIGARAVSVGGARSGADAFVVYDRSGNNTFVTRFEIVEAPGVDAVTETDGIEVINFDLGGPFVSGLFIVQDHVNEGPTEAPQNLKLIPWADIAGAVTPNLIVAPEFDPR